MMQKKLVLGVAMIFIILGFCGCTGVVNDGEMMSYTVESFTWMGEKISDGFSHDESVNYFKIQGTVKNTLDHTANFNVKMEFFDESEKLLGSETIRLANIPKSETMKFTTNINKHVMRFSDYWDSIADVKFSIKEY